jgi:hypothetical protein
VCAESSDYAPVVIFRDVEVLLNRSVGVREEGPVGAHRRAELLQSAVVMGGVEIVVFGVCIAGCRRLPVIIYLEE